MVSLLLVRQEVSVSGSEPSKQTFRVKNSLVNPGSPGVNPPVIGGDPILDLNFINGYYKVNGVSYSAGEVVDHPEYIDATGLAIPAFGDIVSIIGDALAVLLPSQWTLVLCWDNFDSTNTIVPFVLIGPDSDNGVQIKRQNSFSSNFMNVEDFAGIDFRGATDSTAPIGDGQHTVAVTRTNPELAFSVDGRDVTFPAGDPLDFPIFPNAAAFGGQAPGTIGDAFTVKCLRVFAPQADAILPALSVQSCGLPPIPPVPPVSEAKFSVLTGNFLQVIDLIGPAPLPDTGDLRAGPDDRREKAIGKLAEWD